MKQFKHQTRCQLIRRLKLKSKERLKPRERQSTQPAGWFKKLVSLLCAGAAAILDPGAGGMWSLVVAVGVIGAQVVDFSARLTT
jgi:hypothetical protein